jgi:hypothetical protein
MAFEQLAADALENALRAGRDNGVLTLSHDLDLLRADSSPSHL